MRWLRRLLRRPVEPVVAYPQASHVRVLTPDQARKHRGVNA